MSITEQTIRHVATLARLQISDAEIQTYTDQLSRILGLMEQLRAIPTDGVAPMSHAVEMSIPEREDRVENGDRRDAMLANAPDAEEGCFRVPKIIE
ncbi:MAG: Asp-tRNA(Asn)/Glu-tRNA(Gln) amidotransferase subunit GatC [Magnetococcales bacterium]|nr:Asp-tRNA(Asn)/Glu-tRNA(Gln) amidotransferase subunit GatC [Magnetococcales bacterium]MBF0261491.1 Asp-tRNA(Asn)/Glu-tRNA(Gln) amidotransferase subunit GatC [Magnetococcales bacterium]